LNFVDLTISVHYDFLFSRLRCSVGMDNTTVIPGVFGERSRLVHEHDMGGHTVIFLVFTECAYGTTGCRDTMDGCHLSSLLRMDRHPSI
jgi:hypothetical protein